MEILLLLFMFICAILVRTPITYALGLSTLIYITFIIDMPYHIIPQRMVASLNSFPILAVPMYILLGKLMNMGGITNRIFGFAKCLVGHFVGGLAHVNVVSSIFFSGMSGSALADAAGLGIVEIKAMKDQGFPDAFSAAVTAVSSTIGPVIPPSIILVIYGVLASASIGKLFMAGVVPGLIMGIGMMLIIAFISHKRSYPVSEKATFRELKKSFFEALPSLFTIVIIFAGIIGGIFTPTEAGAVAVLYSLFLVACYKKKKANYKFLKDAFLSTAITTGAILIVFSTASIFAWLITIEQIPETLSGILLSITSNKYFILIFINIVLIVMGMLMDVLSILIITVPVFAPIVIDVLGLDPVHFGVIVVLNLMLGGLTPPFAMLLFVVCKTANVKFEEAIKETLPFYIPILIILMIITFVPAISLFLPNLLFR